MKATKARVRILGLLSQPMMYADPRGYIPGTLTKMPSGMEANFRESRLIERSEVPQRKGYVWKITDKGRAWLSNADQYLRNKK